MSARSSRAEIQEGDFDSVSTDSASICQPWKYYLAFRNARIVTIEPAIFFFMFATFLYTPLYQQYYYVKYGAQLLENTSFPFPNGSFCLNSSEVDKYAGNGTYKVVETWSDHLVLYGQVANRVPSILATIIIGPLSDRFGRNPVILASSAGRTVLSALSLVIIYFNWNPYYFILANFLSGLTGDFPAMIAATSSYLADISTPKWKSFRIGIATGLISLGALIGQFSIGYWLKATNCDFVYPMCAVTAGYVLIIAYILLFLPESLSRKEREELVLKNPRGLKSLTQGFRIFTGRVPGYSVWRLWFLLISICILLVNVTGWEYTNVYFLKAPPLDFNPILIGYYQSTYSGSRFLASTILVGILIAVGTPDSAIALIGMSFNAAANLLTGFSRKLYQVFAIAAFQGVDSISWSGIRGYMSNLVAREDQGALFAMIASAEAIASLLASIVWPLIYPITLKHNLSPGTTFFFMAGVMVLVLPLPLILVIFHKRKDKDIESQENGIKQPLFSENERAPLLNYSINTKLSKKKDVYQTTK